MAKTMYSSLQADLFGEAPATLFDLPGEAGNIIPALSKPVESTPHPTTPVAVGGPFAIGQALQLQGFGPVWAYRYTEEGLWLHYGERSISGPFLHVKLAQYFGEWFADGKLLTPVEVQSAETPLAEFQPLASTTETQDGRAGLYEVRNAAARRLKTCPVNGAEYLAALGEMATAQKALGSAWR